MLVVRTEMLPLTSYVQFAYTIPPFLCMGRKTMNHAICQVVFKPPGSWMVPALIFFSSSADKMWCAEKKPSVLYRKMKDNWLEKPGTLPVLGLVHGDLAVRIRNEPTFLRFRGKWKGKLCRRQVMGWQQSRNVINEKLLLPSCEMWATARIWCCAVRIDGKANSGKAAVCCSINSSDNSNASDSWLFTIIYHRPKVQWKPPRAPSRNP